MEQTKTKLNEMKTIKRELPKMSKTSSEINMLPEHSLTNIKQWDEEVTNYHFAEKQRLVIKQEFILGSVMDIDWDDDSQIEAAGEYIKDWTEGAINRICSDCDFIDEFRRYVDYCVEFDKSEAKKQKVKK